MKSIIKILAFVLVFTACSGEKKSSDSNLSDVHKVVVQEVLHVRDYSYIRVLDDGQEKWIAAPITAVEIGGTYYIGKTMEMQNFESKDLGRTFEKVYFVEKLSSDPNNTGIHTTPQSQPQDFSNTNDATKPVIDKKEVSVEAPKDGISLAELFRNKEKYNGQVVKLSGKVTKFNPAIMKTNWLHIQDGTEFNGVFDLTVTTAEAVEIGQTVTIQGTVTLNKDFGAGYFYNIIVENAEIIN